MSGPSKVGLCPDLMLKANTTEREKLEVLKAGGGAAVAPVKVMPSSPAECSLTILFNAGCIGVA